MDEPQPGPGHYNPRDKFLSYRENSPKAKFSGSQRGNYSSY